MRDTFLSDCRLGKRERERGGGEVGGKERGTEFQFKAACIYVILRMHALTHNIRRACNYT